MEAAMTPARSSARESASRAAYVLSGVIATLAALTSLVGVLAPTLYRDNLWVTSQLLGNDWTTLVVAVPLLAGTQIMAMRGSDRARLVWLGTLYFMLYNYAFYLFGTAFSRLSLAFVALVSLSIFALIFGLVGLDAEGIGQRFAPKTPVRSVAVWMGLIVLGLGGAWIAQWVAFMLSGALPESVVASGQPVAVVFCVDLTMLVPVFALGAVWLWRRRPWGYVLGTALPVSGAIYTFTLVMMGVTAAMSRGVPNALMLMPLWGFLCLGSVVAAAGMLRSVQPRG